MTGIDLQGQVAVVIGGTSGIGRTLALGLARAGADVVASARRAELVEDVSREIAALGRRTIAVTSDVTDRASLEALLGAVLAKLGGVHILVNCAGITQRGPTLDFAEADWNTILNVNLTGTLRACQIFGRHLLEQGYGRIVNIASIASNAALMEVAAYGASKAGVASLTSSLAIEWGKRGVNVNAIAPGVFLTDLNRDLLTGTERGREFLLRTPLGRFGESEELVGACVFLSSESASYVNGVLLPVDGGFLASGVNQ